MQVVQINPIKDIVDHKFEIARKKFLETEVEIIKNLKNMEQQFLQGKPLSNAQDFLRRLCQCGFFIDDIARETQIELSLLQSLLCLKRRDLNEADFSSLLFFYCAVECGYLTPQDVAQATQGIH